MEKISKTLDHYRKTTCSAWRNIVFPVVRPEFSRPIFIVGCSRAGTTVVYKVVGMAHDVATMHKESHDFWFKLHPPSEKNWDSHILTARDVGEHDMEMVTRFFYRALGAMRFVDKANQNCFAIPYLLALFPNAIFVYIKRDGRDNINSLIHGWGRPDEYATWSTDLPYDVMIDGGRYHRWCFFLFRGWRAFLSANIEDVCAQQWIEANKAILSARRNVPGSQWVEIFYEDILQSPIETFKRVFKKLDLTFDDEIKQHCDNLSSRPYNAFSTPRLHKWKDENRERIERITPNIKNTMLDLGYTI